MPRMNTAFRDRFNDWLKAKRLSGMAAAFASGLVVSVGTVNNWKRGQEPSAEAVRVFFAQFDGEDVESWLALLERDSVAA